MGEPLTTAGGGGLVRGFQTPGNRASVLDFSEKQADSLGEVNRNKRSPQCGVLSRAARQSCDYGFAVRVRNHTPIEVADNVGEWRLE